MDRRLLLCTDLDRTLLPNGPQAPSPGAAELFARFVEHPAVTLAYVSGRDRALVEEAIATWSLPQPDAVIGDVGTTLWTVSSRGEWSLDALWQSEIDADWVGKAPEALAACLSGVAQLELQPEAQQNTHKLSYFLPASAPWAPLREEIEGRLRDLGVRARLIHSIDETRDQGLLDIVPARASKLHAIEALMHRQGVSANDTVFCGDSGNDLEVLVSHLPAVLVANATDAVREAARAGARARGHADQLYLAEGGFMGMNGCYAAGMLEGIVHFHSWIGPVLAAKAGAS